MLRVRSTECQDAGCERTKTRRLLFPRRKTSERSGGGRRGPCPGRGIRCAGVGFAGASFQGMAEMLLPALDGRAYECGEKRVRGQRLRLEFGVELAADEPRMIRNLDDFHVNAIGRAPGD